VKAAKKGILGLAFCFADVSMRFRSAAIALAIGSLPFGAAAIAQRVDLGTGSIVETVKDLRAGEYVWAPEIAPEGPTLLIVNLKTQRATLYRNGVPIGASTASTGRPGYETPTGVFTILQKQVEHYSSKYDNAPMPYMQRLTWYGIALHGGNLPGYPASHGCIRLPAGFAKLLYGETRLGMTVVIMNDEVSPRLASPPAIAQPFSTDDSGNGREFVWQPERSPTGPISIVVSVADRRAVVLRNGVEIGSGPVAVDGPISGSWAYALRSIDSTGQHWIRVPLSAQGGDDSRVPREEWQRFNAPASFRRAIAGIVEPGTTVVVTPDSLKEGATGTGLTVIEAEPTENP
jgi:hypothetical protein